MHDMERLRAAGGDVTQYLYEGQNHAFMNQVWYNPEETPVTRVEVLCVMQYVHAGCSELRHNPTL